MHNPTFLCVCAGSDEIWVQAEAALAEALADKGWAYKVCVQRKRRPWRPPHLPPPTRITQRHRLQTADDISKERERDVSSAVAMIDI